MKNDEVSGLGVWENWGAVNHIRGLYLGDMGKVEMPAKIIHPSSLPSKPSIHLPPAHLPPSEDSTTKPTPSFSFLHPSIHSPIIHHTGTSAAILSIFCCPFVHTHPSIILQLIHSSALHFL